MRLPSVLFSNFRSGSRCFTALLALLSGALLLIGANVACAAVPPVVVDGQGILWPYLLSAESVAATPPSIQPATVYVADTQENRVVNFTDTFPGVISTGSYTLVNPQALAVDSSGDLFIADLPSSGTARILEAMATGGLLNGTVNLITTGSPLSNVTALTVDTNPSSSTFNTLYIADAVSGAIYTIASGTTTVSNLGITGLPSGVLPAALAKDAAGNLFIADFYTTLYEVPSGSTAAETYTVSGFTINSPTGLAFDPGGNLYILTLGVPFGTSGGTPVEEIVEVPGEDAASAFQVPLAGVESASAVAADNLGNLYVVDYDNNDLIELAYANPIPLSPPTPTGTASPALSFNYEFNTSFTMGGFQAVSQGDPSTEFLATGGTCSPGTYAEANDGNAITPADPYLCQENFAAQPGYPGIRSGAVELQGAGSSILVSTPVFSSGSAGASVVYPLTATAGPTGLQAPEALAYSGLNKKLYIASSEDPVGVYSTIGPYGTALTPVNTGSITLAEPSGLALNAVGDLYIADPGLGKIVVVPEDPSVAPYAFNPGGLLIYPDTLAFDFTGNLYIGDEGPAGYDASSSNPGFLVEVPVNGTPPFKIGTGTVTVVFPQCITTFPSVPSAPTTADLFVCDGGDTDGSNSEIVYIPPGAGSGTSVATYPGEYDPVGIAFDGGGNFYFLDNLSNSIVVYGNTAFTLPFDNTLLGYPSAMAMTAGGQSIAVANADDTAFPSVVYLNGQSSPFNFGGVASGGASDPQTATVMNIGNENLTLNTPYFTSNNGSAQFGVSTSTVCADGLVIAPSTSCTMDLFFEPPAVGAFTGQLILQTNGYNNGISKIALQGTGDPVMGMDLGGVELPPVLLGGPSLPVVSGTGATDGAAAGSSPSTSSSSSASASPPASSSGGSTSSTAADATALLQKALTALGGSGAWSAVHAADLSGTLQVSGNAQPTAINWIEDWSTGTLLYSRTTGSKVDTYDGKTPVTTTQYGKQRAISQLDPAATLAMHLPGASIVWILNHNGYSVRVDQAKSTQTLTCIAIGRAAVPGLQATFLEWYIAPATATPDHIRIRTPDLLRPLEGYWLTARFQAFTNQNGLMNPSTVLFQAHPSQGSVLQFQPPQLNPTTPPAEFAGGDQ